MKKRKGNFFIFCWSNEKLTFNDRLLKGIHVGLQLQHIWEVIYKF
jgi:hypothetical protein